MTNILRLRSDSHNEGVLVAEYEWKRYRFLLSDGQCMDVEAVMDGSWLREEVLKIANNKTKLPKNGGVEIYICGCAEIGATSTTRLPAKLPAKKAVKKAT